MSKTQFTMRPRTAVPRLSRADKARRLPEFGHVHPTGRAGHYLVDSDSGSRQYRVEVGQFAYCQCEDWRKTYERTGERGACKHSGAVYLYRAAIRASWRPAASAPARSLVPSRLPYCATCGADLVAGQCSRHTVAVRTLNLPSQGDRPVRVPAVTVAA